MDLSAAIATVGLLLAGTSYYLGLLLVSMPIGHRDLKDAGWELVTDGGQCILVLTLYSSMAALVRVWWTTVSKLWYGGRGDLEAYSRLYSGAGANAATALGVLLVFLGIVIAVFVSIVFGTGGLGALLGAGEAAETAGVLLKPFSTLYGWVFIVQCFVKGFASFVYNCWFLLLSMGFLLYCLPRRVGRRIGKGLVLFSLYFYLTTPLIPDLTQTLAAGTPHSWILPLSNEYYSGPFDLVRLLLNPMLYFTLALPVLGWLSVATGATPIGFPAPYPQPTSIFRVPSLRVWMRLRAQAKEAKQLIREVRSLDKRIQQLTVELAVRQGALNREMRGLVRERQLIEQMDREGLIRVGKARETLRRLDRRIEGARRLESAAAGLKREAETTARFLETHRYAWRRPLRKRRLQGIRYRLRSLEQRLNELERRGN